MGLLKTISKLLGQDILGSIGDKVEESIEQVQERVSSIVKMVIKSLALFMIGIIGFIFLLVGISQYLEKNFEIVPGMGFIYVGGGLLVLTIIVKLLK